VRIWNGLRSGETPQSLRRYVSEDGDVPASEPLAGEVAE
jgi:hypothetical protein